MSDDIGNLLGVEEEKEKKPQNQQDAEIKKSAIGTTFTVLGVLNLIVGLISFITPTDGEPQAAIVTISCLSGMFICFAISSALHFMSEIAHRLAILQASAARTEGGAEKRN